MVCPILIGGFCQILELPAFASEEMMAEQVEMELVKKGWTASERSYKP